LPDIHNNRCTIHDVARLAGVSHVTVSRAFSKNASIAGETRAKVLEAAGRLGYRPNPLARGLRGGRTKSLAVIGSLDGAGLSGLYRLLALRLQGRGYVVSVIDAIGGGDYIKEALAGCASRNVDGVVLDGWPGDGFEELLGSFSAVAVITGERLDVGFDQVVRERGLAIRAIADHFVDTGRRCPGVIANVPGEDYKVRPFVGRLKERGISVLLDGVVNLDIGVAGARIDLVGKALDEAFVGGFPLDSLFCSTDEVAVAAMCWLGERGLSVPGDVAVVGFNDDKFGKYLRPGLASVARHNEQVVDALEKMLMGRLEEGVAVVSSEVVPMEFVVRGSAG